MISVALAGDLLSAVFVDTHDAVGEWHQRDFRQVIKAADIALHAWVKPACDAYLNGWTRHGNIRIKTAGAETIYPVELVPFVMPSGASSVTLGTVSGDTVTVTNGGLLIDELGVITATTGIAPRKVAGQLLSHYYYNCSDDRMAVQDSYVRQLTAGDFCWLIRNGRTKLAYTGSAPAEGDPLTFSGSTAGKVAAAAAIDTTSTTTTKNTLLARLLGAAGPDAGSYATARAAGSGGWVEADLDLPKRYSHTTS